jgi:hypothetical protein
MAYSGDYREAAIAFERAGHIFAELKEAFEIVPRMYYNWLELKEETSLLEAREAEHRYLNSLNYFRLCILQGAERCLFQFGARQANGLFIDRKFSG